jgi:hypothetical protein
MRKLAKDYPLGRLPAKPRNFRDWLNSCLGFHLAQSANLTKSEPRSSLAHGVLFFTNSEKVHGQHLVLGGRQLRLPGRGDLFLFRASAAGAKTGRAAAVE